MDDPKNGKSTLDFQLPEDWKSTGLDIDLAINHLYQTLSSFRQILSEREESNTPPKAIEQQLKWGFVTASRFFGSLGKRLGGVVKLNRRLLRAGEIDLRGRSRPSNGFHVLHYLGVIDKRARNQWLNLFLRYRNRIVHGQLAYDAPFIDVAHRLAHAAAEYLATVEAFLFVHRSATFQEQVKARGLDKPPKPNVSASYAWKRTWHWLKVAVTVSWTQRARNQSSSS